jgi:hypothetical protein
MTFGLFKKLTNLFAQQRPAGQSAQAVDPAAHVDSELPPLSSLQDITENAPGIYRTETVKNAQRLIMRKDVVAVVVPLSNEFAAACRDFAQFASDRRLTYYSCAWHDPSLNSNPQNCIALDFESELDGANPQEDKLGQDKLAYFFKQIGFTERYPESANTLLHQTLCNRRTLAEMFPDQRSYVSTQANIGQTVASPHMHSDIGIGMTIVGSTTILVSPERAKHLNFQKQQRATFDLLQSHEVLDDIESGLMSVMPNMLLFFKGYKDLSIPFGTQGNLGAAHCSPENTESPRLFIGSFVVPKDLKRTPDVSDAPKTRLF